MPNTALLVSTAKSSDSGLRALLHPLVLLTISDFITRHTLRQQTQPIVGALLGQQNGREVSLEYAYEVKLIQAEDGSAGWILDDNWFSERLQQYKDVHKAPALDLVGWWTTCPEAGPGREVLGIHEAVMTRYNEAALLLAFHPSTVLGGGAVGGKLPLTIYESVYESSATDPTRDMQIDEEGAESLQIKFRELGYEVVTGEAEMISVDFVARGGGNATAVDANAKKAGKPQSSQTSSSEKREGNGKGKEKAAETEAAKAEDASGLTAEDEELIASLTARANATRMLRSRLSLLKAYLEQLPPSYLTTTAPPPPSSDQSTSDTQVQTSHTLLRSILALTARLPLLIPADQGTFQKESQAEKSDVSLVALLAGLGQNVKEARELGIKFATVESARAGGRKGGLGMVGMGMGGGDWVTEMAMDYGDGDGFPGGGGDGADIRGGPDGINARCVI
ncbi:hypothetical protein MMC30_004755 [Trapelia coarctata]|nr:hypothetical protein [Trapelia coarctata]